MRSQFLTWNIFFYQKNHINHLNTKDTIVMRLRIKHDKCLRTMLKMLVFFRTTPQFCSFYASLPQVRTMIITCITPILAYINNNNNDNNNSNNNKKDNLGQGNEEYGDNVLSDC